MAKSLITRHELESIVNMKLSADSEKEMKSKLAKIFEGADIDFNSKEFERSFKNIVSAFNAVFSEAGIDAIDLMPGKDEFKKLGEIAYNEFMSAWKTVGEKGGMKFNFNTDQLDEVIDKLDIIAKNTAKTTKASLKKSADEINAAIYRLDKEQKKYESIKKAIEYDGKSSKPKQATIENLEKGYHNAENWEDQYQYLIKYVKTYEKLNELGTVEFTKGQTDLYKTLSKQVDQARTSLSNLLMTKEQISAGMTIGGGTVSINSESLAQEETLSGIKKILEDRLPSQSNTQKTEKPSSSDIKSDTPSKDKPVTKSDLEEYVVYRAVDDYEDKRTTRAEGYKNYNAEYWTNSKKTAESYTDAHYGTSYVLKGKIVPRNPLIIDAEEAQWDDFKRMPKLMELFPDLADFMDKNKNPRYDSDSGQAYINEQAKKAGYDVVIMKNVQDGYMADQDGDAPLTTTFAVLEDSVISITGAFKEIAEENGNKKFSTAVESIPSFYDVPEHQKNELMRTAIFQELAKYGTFQQAKDAGRGKIEFSGQEVQFGRLVSDYFKDVLGSTFNPKEFEGLWKEARKQFYTFTPKELTKDEAVDILRDKMPENVLEGWFRKGDSTYKSKIEELALSDDDIRNAALNIMWDNYKHSSGKDIGFDEFLHSDIPMYRGKNSEKYTDGDETLAFTFDKSVAEKFGKYVLETFVKPIETLGAYQTTGESEALVYRKQLEDKAEYKQWHEDMSNKNTPQAVYSAETIKTIENETAALTQQNEELRENNTLKREENTIVDGDNRNKNIDDKNFQTAIDESSLKNILEGIVYNVKIADESKDSSADAKIASTEENKTEQIDPDIDKKIADVEYVIKNANAWLKMLDGLLGEHTFDTTGKQDATDTLKSRAHALNSYYNNPSQYGGESFAEEKRIVAYGRAYQEAIRQNVAQSTLDRNRNTLAESKYSEAVSTLQKEREWWAKTLSEKEVQLSVLKQEKETGNIVSTKASETSKRSSESIPKLTENIDTTEEVQSLENVRAKVEDIKTEVEAKTGAFTAEETEVKRVVDAELEALKPLEQKVKDIKDAVTGLNEQAPTEEPVDKSENIPLKDDNIVNETDLAKIKELHSNIEEVARSIKEVVNNVVTDETSLQTSVKNSVVKIVQAVQTGQEQLGKLNTSAETLKNNLKGLFENITSGEVNLAEGLSNINVTVNYPKTEQNDLEPVADAIDNLGTKLDSNTGESKSTKNNTNKKTATETTAQKTVRYAKRINSYVGKIYSVLKNTQSTKDVANISNTSDDTISVESSVASSGETHKESTTRNNQTSVNSLVKEYQRLGQMEAKFEVSGNLETKERIDQLKKYIKAKEISLELTQQEIDDLEKRRIEAHDDEIMLSKASDQEKDRVIAVRELESLYRRLGATEGLLTFRGDKDDASLTQEIDLIQKEIADKKKLIPINQSLIDQFEKLRDNSKHQTVAIETVKEKQQWQNDFKSLGVENQKLAKLDAQAEVTDDPVIQERARQLREIVDKEYERLGLNDQQHAQEKEVLKTSYEQIRAEETKIQLAKQAKKDIADNIKKARQDAKDSTMTSTRKKGETALGSLWKMEDFSIDELKNLPEVKELQTAIVNLKKTQSEVNTKIRNKEELTTVDNDKITESISNVTKYSEAIKALVKNYEFFSGDNSFDLEKKLDPGEDTQAQLIAAAKALHGTKIKVVSYDAATQQLNYTIDDGHNNLTSYTAGVREVDKALRTVQGTTKKTETLFEAIGRKTKEVLTYFTGSSVIYKGIEELRRGVQYVREIDVALTELKKVTDETEESYERFLDTASKTADKVGSTIAKVVNSTADFARLGSMLAKLTSGPLYSDI